MGLGYGFHSSRSNIARCNQLLIWWPVHKSGLAVSVSPGCLAEIALEGFSEKGAQVLTNAMCGRHSNDEDDTTSTVSVLCDQDNGQ
jgi:hypothetical protein